MKKLIVGCLGIVLMVSFLYVEIGTRNVKNKLWDYLKQEGYQKSEILSVEIKHSFINIFLSYNEWTIDVVYEDEPTSIYGYTFKDNEIVESGVSGTTDKEDLKH